MLSTPWTRAAASVSHVDGQAIAACGGLLMLLAEALDSDGRSGETAPLVELRDVAVAMKKKWVGKGKKPEKWMQARCDDAEHCILPFPQRR